MKNRRWPSLPSALVGAAIGLAVANVVGDLWREILGDLGTGFVPLSAFLVASVAWVVRSATSVRAQERPGKRKSLAASAIAAAFGVLALAACDFAFVAREDSYGVAVLTSWQRNRSEPECAGSLGNIIDRKKTLNPNELEKCWEHLWAVQLLLTVSYLWTLTGLGAVVGLARRPRPLPRPFYGPSYLNFDLAVERIGNDRYRVEAASGERRAETEMALDPDGLPLPAHDRISSPGRGGAVTRTPVEPPQRLGGLLYQAMFRGDVGACFARSVEASQGDPACAGLRLRLDFEDVPELAALPWEYLYDEGRRAFLALSHETPVVRFLGRAEQPRPLLVEPPVRVLAMFSQPDDWEALDAEAEWKAIRGALEPLVKRRRVVLERLEDATFRGLQRRLRTGPAVHVLHFVGHGTFAADRGTLILMDRDRRGRASGSASIANLLQDHRHLRLVVLNSCHGARSAPDDALAGSAQALALRNVPAVVAMQHAILDDSARLFAEGFYEALADGLPVDAAVSEARKVLEDGGTAEWGTVVLYLRAADGTLLEPVEGSPAGEPASPATAG